MKALKQFAPVLATAFTVGAAAPAQALEVGCGPFQAVFSELAKEGQIAFGKGTRLTTPAEVKIFKINHNELYGLRFLSNQQGTRGYIVHTNIPISEDPNDPLPETMCVDHVIGNMKPAVDGQFQPADVRTKPSYTGFSKSPLLNEYIKSDASSDQYVLFQADELSKGKNGYETNGTIITVTANMISTDKTHKGRGAIMFTEAANGRTSQIYATQKNDFTAAGKKMIEKSLATTSTPRAE